MRDFITRYTPLLEDATGVESILLEMERQMDDVRATYATQGGAIKEFAHSIKQNTRIIMLGMGASHWVNALFALQLRKAGIYALAIPASEFLYDPIPLSGELVLLTSQSGESVETVKCLQYLKGVTLYGITLNKESTIGHATKAIIAAGGAEKAFAGTRSVTLTLACMAYICAELEMFPAKTVHAMVDFRQDNLDAMHAAVALLHTKSSIVATGRSVFSPLAQLFALGGEELGGKPILCNETGQLRHGPLEVLSTNSVVVLFRQSGELGVLAKSFTNIQEKTGCSLIVIDSSGLEPLEGAITIACPAGNDIAAALAVMETFQSLMIAYACGKNKQTGIPKYSTKITKTE